MTLADQKIKLSKTSSCQGFSHINAYIIKLQVNLEHTFSSHNPHATDQGPGSLTP